MNDSQVSTLLDTQRLSFEGAPSIRTTIPGPRSKSLLESQDSMETHSRTYTNYFPIAIAEGRGSTLKDLDGNVFIDWFGGVCVLNLGHGNPIVLRPMMDQLQKLSHITELPTEARLEFLRTLLSTLPGRMKDNATVMFTVSGADAVEAAISLARAKTKKKTIIAFGGAYHGIYGSVVSATANYHYREFAGVPSFETYHLPFPYWYRFPLKVRESEMSQLIIDNLEYLIKDSYSGVGPIAGVVVEPIQGEGGYVVPPRDFLPMLREVTEKYGILLIVDEVQSGVGRTGNIWATEHYPNLTPDIVCISKSIGGGIPTSMIAYRKDLDEGLPGGFHLGTYRGNPVALAGGNAILGHLKSSSLLDRVRTNGEFMRSRFEEVTKKLETVGEVRGVGYMIGIELVKDKTSRAPNTELASRVRARMFKKGVLMHTCGHFGNVMRFMAPLTIEDDLIEKGLNVFESSIRES